MGVLWWGMIGRGWRRSLPDSPTGGRLPPVRWRLKTVLSRATHQRRTVAWAQTTGVFDDTPLTVPGPCHGLDQAGDLLHLPLVLADIVAADAVGAQFRYVRFLPSKVRVLGPCGINDA